MAHRVIERVEARYEAREVPFGKLYERHPAYLAIECECGEQLVLTATTTTTACRCGTRFGGFVNDLQEWEGQQEWEGHLQDSLVHPWFYDAQARAQQRLRDEAAYPEGSPWRYDDVTADKARKERRERCAKEPTGCRHDGRRPSAPGRSPR